MIIRREPWVYVVLTTALFCACSATSRNSVSSNSSNSSSSNAPSNLSGQNEVKGATIPIDAGGPADTVRAFYKLLRERRFREAIFLTNLRPAVEGLTDTELKDFAVDFEALAGQVPAEIEINGEIISGDSATVTANLPTEDGEKKTQPIKLKKEGDIWVILSVDDANAAKIRKEGKQYFFNLRIETHEEEARKMLDRISKAEMVHSLQNGGTYTDLESLIKEGLLPEDARSSESTGYNYTVEVAPDKKSYSGAASPAAYGKTGRLTFSLARDKSGQWRITSKDDRGGR
jgi:hypothetical protein